METIDVKVIRDARLQLEAAVRRLRALEARTDEPARVSTKELWSQARALIRAAAARLDAQ